MSELNEDYIRELRLAVVRAICEVSASRQGSTPPGEARTLYIGTAEVCEALTFWRGCLT
jgi:hypothetical protein